MAACVDSGPARQTTDWPGDDTTVESAPDVGNNSPSDADLDVPQDAPDGDSGDPDDANAPDDVEGDAPEDADATIADVSDDADAELDAPQDALEDIADDTNAGDTDAADTSSDTSTDAAEDIAADTTSDADQDTSTNTARVRIMAANTTSGNFQSYDPGHGIRIFQGLDPDVVLIQEFSYGNNSDSAIRAFVDDTFGSDFSYTRESGAQLPNGVISRYPIIDAGVWEDQQANNREFVWARLDIPGSLDLWAVSVHFLTRDPATRDQEATQLVSYVEANIPEGDLLVIGGDFNTDDFEEPALATLEAVISRAHVPADSEANPHTNQSRRKPYDHVLPDLDLDALHVPVVIGESSFPEGLVFDSRVYTPLADVEPVLIGDSEAPMMQHMAVIKDFRVVVEGE